MRPVFCVPRGADTASLVAAARKRAQKPVGPRSTDNSLELHGRPALASVGSERYPHRRRVVSTRQQIQGFYLLSFFNGPDRAPGQSTAQERAPLGGRPRRRDAVRTSGRGETAAPAARFHVPGHVR